MFDQVDDLADHQANHDAQGCEISKAKEAGSESRRTAPDQQGDPELKRQQRGGVIQQAFAFKNIDSALGQPDALGNRGRCNGIGRRHHGA